MTRLFRFGCIAVLAMSTMGSNACPNTMPMPGTGTGTGTGTGGTTPTPPANMMTAEELQLAMDALAAMNTHRATKGLAAYTWYLAGALVADAHNTAMETGNFFAHVDPNTNTDPATRALNAGIVHDPLGSIDPTSGNPFVGENLFMSSGSVQTGQGAVDSWIGSPGHHTQIDAPMPVAGAQTMPPWTHCGIGVRKTGTNYWFTAMFFRNPN